MTWALEASLITACLTIGTAGGAGLAWATFKPQSRIWGPNRYRGRLDRPEVALTFDDGPSPVSTPAILNILDEFAVPATFFVVGGRAEKHPDLVRRIHRGGHLLGNHSFDHSHFGIAGGLAYWRQQLSMTDDALFSIVGERPVFFRPPMGFKTRSVMRAASQSGHRTVTWTCRGRDGVPTTPELILKRVLPKVRGGDVILLHDGPDPEGSIGPRASVRALPSLIRGLHGKGLRIVGLDHLLELPAYLPLPART